MASRACVEGEARALSLWYIDMRDALIVNPQVTRAFEPVAQNDQSGVFDLFVEHSMHVSKHREIGPHGLSADQAAIFGDHAQLVTLASAFVDAIEQRLAGAGDERWKQLEASKEGSRFHDAFPPGTAGRTMSVRECDRKTVRANLAWLWVDIYPEPPTIGWPKPGIVVSEHDPELAVPLSEAQQSA